MDKPDGMGARAEDFWDSVAATYSLRLDEWHILRDACSTMNEIERLENVLKNADVMSKGSRGQQVVHPAFAEVARHRALVARLLARLDLPDPVTQRSALSEKRSRASRVRWDRVQQQREGAV